MSIEKFISPFIESQFPLFYQEEGPYFIEFVKAYYSWLETQGEAIYESRSLLEYRDLDSSLDKFIIYFKNKYINSLPENILSDKKLLIKHILDLYRSKGSDQSYALLFKILFNEDIEIYTPGKYLFTLSDNDWYVPKYIELTDSPYFINLIGHKIYSSSTFSTAVVDNYFTKIVENKFVNVLVLNDIKGNFKYGEKILSEAVPELTIDNAPIITGSLSSIGITDGGINYNIGDLLNVNKSGVGGLARVVAVVSKNGQVEFQLIDGGNGFSLDAIVNIVGESLDIKSITNDNPIVIETVLPHNFENRDTLRIDYVLGMEEINISGYSYYANVISTTEFEIYSDYELTTPVDGTTFGTYVEKSGYVYKNTGGTGATFEIGSIVNKEIYRLNTDRISSFSGERIDSFADVGGGLYISVFAVSGTFSPGDIVIMENVDVRELDIEVLTVETLLEPGDSLFGTNYSLTDITVVSSDDTFIQVKGTGINDPNLKKDTLLSRPSGGNFHVNVAFPVKNITASANLVAVTSSGFLSEVLDVVGQEGYFVYGETIKSIGNVFDPVCISISSPTIITVPAFSSPPDGTPVTFEVFDDLSYPEPTLPVGINPGQTYYVKYIDENSFNISEYDDFFTLVNTSTATVEPYETTKYIIYYDKASAIIDKVERKTNYDFPAVSIPDIENLDTPIKNALSFVDKEVGDIAYLKNINSGEGYAQNPIVSIVEPLIYELRMKGSNGGYKGFNANVVASAGYANGIVTAVEIVDSGYGYSRDQQVSLTTANNQYAVTGTTVVDLGGKGKGYWRNNKSFLSDQIYLQDSYYYQKFSYEIIASRMLNTYETYVKDLVHPSGMKLFGRFINKNEFEQENSEVVFSSLNQNVLSTIEPPPSIYSYLTVDNTKVLVSRTTITSDTDKKPFINGEI
jgi:hypothetical protein